VSRAWTVGGRCAQPPAILCDPAGVGCGAERGGWVSGRTICTWKMRVAEKSHSLCDFVGTSVVRRLARMGRFVADVKRIEACCLAKPAGCWRSWGARVNLVNRSAAWLARQPPRSLLKTLGADRCVGFRCGDRPSVRSVSFATTARLTRLLSSPSKPTDRSSGR